MTVDIVDPTVRDISNKVLELVYRETYKLGLKIGLTTFEASRKATILSTTMRQKYDEEASK